MTRSLMQALSVFALVSAVACGGAAPTPEPAPTPAPPAEAPQAAPTPDSAPVDAKKDKDEDGHAHTAPHGGALVEIGDHFAFLEFVVDASTGQLTLYVLDGEAEKPIRLAQKTVVLTVTTPAGVGVLELQGKANTLTGETVGDTSEFVATHAALKGVKAMEGRLREITIKGQALRDLEVHWPDDHN